MYNGTQSIQQYFVDAKFSQRRYTRFIQQYTLVRHTSHIARDNASLPYQFHSGARQVPIHCSPHSGHVASHGASHIASALCRRRH